MINYLIFINYQTWNMMPYMEYAKNNVILSILVFMHSMASQLYLVDLYTVVTSVFALIILYMQKIT